MAIEVKVKAAGLMTMPAALVDRLVDPADDLVFGVGLAELDLAGPPRSRHIASISASVVWP
jgi:hypothetical protein